MAENSIDVGKRKWVSAASVGAVSLAGLIAKKAFAQPGPSPIGTLPGTALPGNYGGIDDPTNASGLGTPAIIRGTVYAHLAAGVTVGAGQTTGVRQATATGLQNAINYASANGKYFEGEPNTYEINSSTGLTIPAGQPFKWIGEGFGTLITQFYTGGTGAPVLTVGDAVGTSFTQGVQIDGVYLQYGASQAGLTSSNYMVVGSVGFSSFANIVIGTPTATVPTNPGRNCIFFQTGGGAVAQFQNKFSDMKLTGFDSYALNISGGQGPGQSIYQKVYINNAAGAFATPATAAGFINLNPTSGSSFDVVFDNVHCEWATVPFLCNIQNAFDVVFRGWHNEGITFTGFNPSYLLTSASQISVEGATCENCLFLTANASGTGAFIYDYGPVPSVLGVRNLVIFQNATSQINMPFKMVLINTPSTAANGSYLFESTELLDPNSQLAGRFSFDTHMPVSGSAFIVPQKFTTYKYGRGGSLVDQAVISVSAAYTHYGQHTNSVIILAATGSYTVTLADTMGASGTQFPPYGSTVTFLRPVYTSGAVTISDGAAGSITTNSSTATVTCQFTPTVLSPEAGAWVTVTPVT